MNDTITVTSPLLPSLDEFIVLLEQIWGERWITNGGRFHRKLEVELARYFSVPYIRTSHVKGQIITPPVNSFSPPPTPSGGMAARPFLPISTPRRAISIRHGLKVIYDAVHAFGVEVAGYGSILRSGYLTTISLHAPKMFNTIKGGAAIFTRSSAPSGPIGPFPAPRGKTFPTPTNWPSR